MNLLLESALKATVILGAAWTAALLLRRASAGVRHLIWVMAMVTVAALPVMLEIPQSAIPAAARIVVPGIGSSNQVAHRLPWLLILWAAGASVVSFRLLAGILAAARIERSAKMAGGILYSDRAAAPMTWGFLRPVVILPSYAAEWSAEERALVLRHERAHIDRHDWLWQMLASVLTAIFWFHPLMWLASLQLRREAESAVDDCVLANGAAPSDYAGRLLDVARRLTDTREKAAVIPMIARGELETRVRSILDPSRPRAGAGLLVRCAIALGAVALILPIAVTRQRVYAQGPVYKVGKDVSAPRVLYKEEPQYTQEAKDAKIAGTVVVHAEIATDGTAQNISVSSSLDPGLDANAITAVSHWRFQPGMKEGRAVTVAVTIEVNFHLL